MAGGPDGWPAFMSYGAAVFARAGVKPAFARYGAAVFVRASEKPAFARYGAAAFARAKAGIGRMWRFEMQGPESGML